jgi:hypothetical protein
LRVCFSNQPQHQTARIFWGHPWKIFFAQTLQMSTFSGSSFPSSLFLAKSWGTPWACNLSRFFSDSLPHIDIFRQQASGFEAERS